MSKPILAWDDELNTGTVKVDKTFCSHAGGSCNALAKLYKENARIIRELDIANEGLTAAYMHGFEKGKKESRTLRAALERILRANVSIWGFHQIAREALK